MHSIKKQLWKTMKYMIADNVYSTHTSWTKIENNVIHTLYTA